MPQFHKGKLKDVNMLPVGLAYTRISTDYSQKPPRSLPKYSNIQTCYNSRIAQGKVDMARSS